MTQLSMFLPADWLDWDAARLEFEVRKHNRLYWDENRPVISDPEFDRLVERLRSINPHSPVLDALGPDPAARVGEPVTHRQAMLSLEKCYDEKTLLDWAAKFEGDVVMTPKVDGCACSIRYGADGRLEVAATRGSGTVGEDITANVKRIPNVPARLPVTAPVEIRGEVYLPLSAFAKLAGEFANPRNTAAGALKQKDPAKSAAVGLRFMAYDVVGAGLETEVEKFAQAAAWGFEPVEHALLDRAGMQAGYESYVARRQQLDYEIDGVVFRANRVDEQVRLGATSHHPRGAIAYKLQGESGLTILRDVEWSVSRSRIFTPVGIVDPVSLSGATVTRISLHNWGMVRSKGLSIGAECVAVRRGGVIPYLESVSVPGETPIDYPKTCPTGGFPLREEGDIIVCSCATGCAGAIVGVLSHYANAVGIEGFGDIWLQTLVDAGLLTQPADFYRLRPEDLITFDRMGETLAAKLVENCATHQTDLPLAVFLAALGVPGLGRTASQTLARHFRSLERVRAATPAELLGLPKFAELSAEKIAAGLAAQAHTIDALLAAGVTVATEPEPAATDAAGGPGPFTGKSFLFTGTLAAMTREAAQARVEALGGKAASGVSKALSYLVVGSEGKAGSKLQKAQEAGVTVLTEAEFIALLDATAAP
ncbi:NAD-dependent DNA ligase LigA [Myxococcota bacterium]|nr:NAD-dependent DNA ligase LigA [Myxococcota bacterium]